MRDSRKKAGLHLEDVVLLYRLIDVSISPLFSFFEVWGHFQRTIRLFASCDIIFDDSML